MAEEVDATDAAPAGYETSNAGDTGAARRTDTPIDPDYVATRDLDLSPGRRIVYRAETIGWIKTSIVERRSAETSMVSGKHKIPIKNVALRKPDGVDLNPDRGPISSAQGAPAGATAKATPEPKPEMVDLPPSSGSSSPPLGPDQLKPKKKEKEELR
eukprot:7284870-Pyramimonas_sp.AAC.1